MPKHTTLEQMKLLAQRTKGDSAGRELERQSSDCKGQHPFG